MILSRAPTTGHPYFPSCQLTLKYSTIGAPTPLCGRWHATCNIPSWCNKGKPAVVFRASLVYIPAHQARTNLSNTLSYLKQARGDCVILVSTPTKPTYSPQPQRGRYFTLSPINSDSGVDCGPLSSFAVATLHVASREGWGDNMAVRIKLLPCFGSSKCTKYELIVEAVLSRGPLWQNVHYVEHKSNGEVIVG